MVNLRYNYIKPITIVLILMQAIPCVMNVNVMIQLIINSTLSLVLGCLISVSIGKDEKKEKHEDEEKIGMKDALQFPFVASAFLLGLYSLYKVLDPKLVTLLFKFNVTMGCWFSIGRYLTENFKNIFYKIKEIIYYKNKFELFGYKLDINISNISIISFTISGSICWSYFFTNHWTLNNFLGFTFIISGIKLVKLPNFKVAFLLLWLLFFYDIFWVFGTDVMISVAKNLDAPIKLLLPSAGKFSMIGLGDIVIPGFLVVLALKFDVDNYLKSNPKMNSLDNDKLIDLAKNMKIPYFTWVVVGYLFGILLTNFIMLVFKHAQPALLYLVPCTTIPLFVKALIDGKLKEFFEYEEEIEEIEKKKK